MALHIHTLGRFNNHTAHSLYRVMVTATRVVGVMKMGNIIVIKLYLERGLNPHLYHSESVCYHFTT